MLPTPLNPTILLFVVLLVGGVAAWLLPGPWWVAFLATAAIVNALLWVHRDWDRRRKGRAQDPTRPYSRE